MEFWRRLGWSWDAAARDRLWRRMAQCVSPVSDLRATLPPSQPHRHDSVPLKPRSHDSTFAHGQTSRITRSPNSVLEPLLGIGDAWSFVFDADHQWRLGERGLAVWFEEKGGNQNYIPKVASSWLQFEFGTGVGDLVNSKFLRVIGR